MIIPPFYKTNSSEFTDLITNPFVILTVLSGLLGMIAILIASVLFCCLKYQPEIFHCTLGFGVLIIPYDIIKDKIAAKKD